MESLKISTGLVRLQILNEFGEERGIFQFNPEDITSAEAVLELQKELEVKEGEFNEKSEKCETDADRIHLLDEVVTYFKDAIDKCFGSGSSNILFGEAKSLTMFNDFLEGITPYYEKASKKRLAKYRKASGK